MASKEHLQLASFVKAVHQDLRQQSKKLGFDKAWKLHCGHQEKLDQYASCMSALATEHWQANITDTSRIEWVHDKCLQYFTCGDLIKHRTKEQQQVGDSLQALRSPTTLRLLDVGSCYNPFREYSMFSVLPIDIAPAQCDVIKCDFLSVAVTSEQCKVNSEITSLCTESFHVVVFSLLLEYLPEPELRFACASKAYDLLTEEGLLFVITPDSKHATANARLMKKWRVALAQLGFWRVYYDKLKHMHCMAFRKSICPEYRRAWSLTKRQRMELSDKVATLMAIPQDFNCEASDKATDRESEERSEDSIIDMFAQLPGS